jgi:hypothetical protein
LIEQKINALDQAAPLAGWRLPEEFMTLGLLLEARRGKQRKRLERVKEHVFTLEQDGTAPSHREHPDLTRVVPFTPTIDGLGSN